MIGAGAAGLSAAWRLVRSGHEVVVHERAVAAGGMLRTAVREGVVADQAVQLLSSTYSETFRLAREAGLAGLLVPASGRDSLWRRGRAHGITYGSVSSMVASGALPTLLKLKLGAKYVPWLTTRAAKLDANDLAGTAVQQDGESIAAWGQRELGEDFVEYLTYPLLAAYYGTPPEEASAALYHALARVGLDVKVHALRGGAGAFARALAEAVVAGGGEVRLEDEVQRVHPDAGGVRLQTSHGEVRYDGAIVATPPQAAAALVEDEGVRSWLAAARTRPAVSVTLWLKQRVPVASFGLSFPRQEPPGDVIVAACIQSRKLEFAPGAQGDAVVVFPSPALLDRDPDDEALGRAVAGGLARALPGIERVVSEIEVVRLEGGYRKFAPGWIRRLAQEPAPSAPALELAGDYLVAPTVEGAVRSGMRAVDRLLSRS